MKKSLFKIFAIVLSVIIIIGIAITAFLNSDYMWSKKLIRAIDADDLASVQEIVEKKPSCVNALPTIMPKWLRYGVFDAARVTYPLIEACGNDQTEIVKALVQAGADVNCNDGRTPLSLTYCGKKENWYLISKYLIENGVSLDYTTEYSGKYSCVLEDIVMVRAGADLPGYIAEDENEVMVSFHHAIENCDHSKVNWRSVLQHSISNNRFEIVQFLLDEGLCEVNDKSGRMTPLMFAARDAEPEMVKLLLEKGADRSAVDSDGMTAYDYAVEVEDQEKIALLKNES